MRNILFLAHRAPFPPDRGDRIRAYNILKYLSARARVHLVAFTDDSLAFALPDGLTASQNIVPRTKSKPRAAIEALATRQSVSVAAFADPALRAAVNRVLADHPIDAIYVFSSAMAQYLPPLPRPRTVMDFCDVDSAKFGEYAEGARFPQSWLFRREARLLGAFDRRIARDADASLFVSAAEAALFRATGGEGDIRVIENGIDTETFDPTATFDTAPAPTEIVFTGQMDYAPNVAAVRWFVRDVLPLIPQARFAIVGRAPTAEVRALAGDRVIVTGEVADVRGWLAASAVAVAPLRIARGIQNKVLEAMAMARPVVASPAAAEGIDHAGTLRIGDDAEAFAAEVSALIADRAMGDALGAAARRQVRARYGWEARLALLDQLLGLEYHPQTVRAEPVEALSLFGESSAKEGQHFDKLSANGAGGVAA